MRNDRIITGVSAVFQFNKLHKNIFDEVCSIVRANFNRIKLNPSYDWEGIRIDMLELIDNKSLVFRQDDMVIATFITYKKIPFSEILSILNLLEEMANKKLSNI